MYIFTYTFLSGPSVFKTCLSCEGTLIMLVSFFNVFDSGILDKLTVDPP